MSRVWLVFLSGLLATLPMTVWMLSLNRAVPPIRPERLPPEEITLNLAKKTAIAPVLTHQQKKGLSLLNHFLYGGFIALPFGFINDTAISINRSVRLGIGYGFLVWLSNYLGLLPALDLYPPATQESPRMNGIMITAHIIWGVVLGCLFNRSLKKNM